MSDSNMESLDWQEMQDDIEAKLLPKDYLYHLDLDFSFGDQLEAIGALLYRNQEVEKGISEEIKSAEHIAKQTTGLENEYACMEHADLCHMSVYQHAAHSMAAVGMLAPFFETIFTQCFRQLGEKIPSSSPSHAAVGSVRQQTSKATQWDCHFVFEKNDVRTDLVEGISQIADAIGLRSRLPADINKTLRALFGYRNKMFHCGLEWPIEERSKFEVRIKRENWPPGWFSKAQTGNEPWVFYMTDEFVEHCLQTATNVVSAFGEFVRDEMLPLIQSAGASSKKPLT